jgi:hypothetical protein
MEVALSMRRMLLLVTVAAMMAAMLVVVAGPATAQGCKAFGVEFVAGNTPHGESSSSHAPVNDEVLALHAAYCD